MATERGRLFILATPLGNLKDISLRALEVLKESDLIAAEDTRRTLKLLSASGFHVPLTSFHENNKHKKISRLLARLEQGQNVTLVTDGGTPGISDPGRELVLAARQAGIPVVPIPGPSALTCALSVSGFSGEAFVFLGFLPRRRSRRKKILLEMAGQERTIILYEAPHRILSLLKEARETLGNRPAILAREMTKLYEEILSDNLEGLIQELTQTPRKGEFTLVLEGSKKAIHLEGTD
jgi:16S rRNA (cytidine1402-2'-O)-methyltransferase